MNKKPNNFQRFRDLSPHWQMALAAAMTERMLPNYQLFVELNQFGDGAVFKSAMALVWEKILYPKSKINLAGQIEKLEPNVPDTQQFDNIGAYLAIDMATALIGLLQGLNNDGDNEFLNAVKISQASVAKFIEFQAEESVVGPELRAHPLMAFEIATLEELIDFCEQHGFNLDNAKAMRQLALSEGVSNIGVELE